MNFKKVLRYSTIIPAILFAGFISSAQTCIIEGKVMDATTKSILLVSPGQDLRFDDVILIPVTDNKFHYELELKAPEAFDLMLGEARENGGGRTMPVFLEKGTTTMVVYPEAEFEKNMITGSALNAAYKAYRQENNYPEKISALYDELNAAREGTTDAEQINGQIEQAVSDQRQWQNGYIRQNPNVVSYYLFLSDLVYDKDNVELRTAKELYAALSKANPNHRYNALASQLIAAIENIKVGAMYVDFTAPDRNGKPVRLSEHVDGRVVLLHLWATWCGPCINKTRAMLPVYNKFKSKGFAIVGVAGEFGTTERLDKFLEKEQWPWPQLVDLDKRQGIWQKYRIDGAGGAMFLIGRDGTIVAINPTAKEVEDYLESLPD